MGEGDAGGAASCTSARERCSLDSRKRDFIPLDSRSGSLERGRWERCAGATAPGAGVTARDRRAATRSLPLPVCCTGLNEKRTGTITCRFFYVGVERRGALFVRRDSCKGTTNYESTPAALAAGNGCREGRHRRFSAPFAGSKGRALGRVQGQRPCRYFF